MTKSRLIIGFTVYFIVFNAIFLAIEMFLFDKQMTKELLLSSAFTGLVGAIVFYFVVKAQIKFKNKINAKIIVSFL